MTGFDDLTRLSPPPAAAPPPSDWDEIENTLGIRLPRDYKNLADTYGPGAFCRFLHVYHPLGATQWVALTGPMPATLRRLLEDIRARDARLVRYDPRNLFAIGVTDNGEHLFWITEPATDPDAWHVAVNEARGRGWYTHPGTLTDFLAAFLGGRTTVPLFPRGLLDHGATFTPSTPGTGGPWPPGPLELTGRSVSTRVVREWARANGYEVPDRGRVPREILDAWNQAEGERS
ncbi:histone-like nucleoid-structuring protein Lsr2 [Streptomyces sp. NPDC056222]|uniref:Lsr2 family DNA-binding protein n=1 Tax=Streptomyces sp. NPDC056222 TaxID=3345749 RepID=UPI0035D64633